MARCAPASELRAFSLKTWETRPISLCTMIWLPLLTSMLQGIQTEVGELGDLFVRRPDTEDSTGVLRSSIRRIKIVIQTAVRWQHCLSLARRGPPHTAATLPQWSRSSSFAKRARTGVARHVVRPAGGWRWVPKCRARTA